MAVTDWLAEGLPGRAAKTVEVYRDALRPVLAVIGRIPLRDLTVQDVRTALTKMAVTHSTPTLQKAHNCLTRALRHAEGRDLVRRNVSALVDTPRGREGRPSQALTLEQAAALLEAAEDSRLHAFIVLCLLTGQVGGGAGCGRSTLAPAAAPATDGSCPGRAWLTPGNVKSARVRAGSRTRLRRLQGWPDVTPMSAVMITACSGAGKTTIAAVLACRGRQHRCRRRPVACAVR